MNLTDLANHICQQCGMNDKDDVSAAKMFLQRRLEMIWNTQLWRSSLIEATLTVNPDGTTTLADTVWIPSRGTLLLPTAFDSVLAVRQDAHAMNVASLESYYRTDTDWLNMQGDPTEFQILRPAVAEFPTPINLFANGAGGSYAFTASADGVTNSSGTGKAGIQENAASLGAFQVVYTFTGSTTAKLDYGIAVINIPPSLGGFEYQGAVQLSALFADNNSVTVADWSNQDGSLKSAFSVLPPDCVSVGGVYADFFAGNQSVPANSLVLDMNVFTGAAGPGPNAAAAFSHSFVPLLPANYSATQNALPVHQRIRLTTNPQLAVNLRVLGKMACPILGDYDSAPINNVEPCLMAYARGDMLLRQRQNGKAQLAAQEGASLLAQLARSEAFQTANNFRIQPDGGFGADSPLWTQPNSFHPL
jgi:hypothetical protein